MAEHVHDYPACWWQCPRCGTDLLAGPRYDRPRCHCAGRQHMVPRRCARDECARLATWAYNPAPDLSTAYLCDEHVPRRIRERADPPPQLLSLPERRERARQTAHEWLATLTPGLGPATRVVLCDELGALLCRYSSAHGWESWWVLSREEREESGVVTLEEVGG